MSSPQVAVQRRTRAARQQLMTPGREPSGPDHAELQVAAVAAAAALISSRASGSSTSAVETTMTLQLHDEVNPTPSAEASNPLGGFAAAAPVAPSVGQPGTTDFKATTGRDMEHPGPSPASEPWRRAASARRRRGANARTVGHPPIKILARN